MSSFKAGRKGLEMNKDAVSDADEEPFKASQGRGVDGLMITPFKGQKQKEEAPANPWEGTVLGIHPGLSGVGGAQSGDDWGDSRVPVALRQPSRCLLTQKRCGHGANLPHGGGVWTRTETGEQGSEGVSGLWQGHVVRVAVTLETVELPRSPAQGSPASQGCSPAHTGAPPGSSVWGS